MPLNDVDLKKTVHLPRTAFAMKANLPQTEPKLLARWTEDGIYRQIRAARSGRPAYILHDGPPYANGNIHLGHAFNKILKDFVVKTKTMSGLDSPYIPGWDCHGLPTEIKVDHELGSRKASMTVAEIRGECRKYAQKYVNLQSQDFQRLGIFGRWDDPYLTMTASYEAQIAQTFVDFLDKGYVYKGLKPVNWCLNCRTSLAEAEIEYEPHVSPSIYVRFPLVSETARVDERLNGWRTFAVIWTTTPWTIPANLGISFNPNFEYAAVAVGKEAYIVAADLVKTVADAVGWTEYAILATFPGTKLDRAVFRHPFLDRDSLGMVGDHVTLEQGTGAVHTAPGHGHEDYVVGLRYGLPVYCPVDGAGRLFQAGGVPGDLPGRLLGQTVWQANDTVLEILREYGALLSTKRYEHSYPHCWRCHKPTIFRGTEQWFISMEHDRLRERTLASIPKIKWLPAWGDDRMTNMIAGRPDWNISRQRVWGVPITVFYCDECSEPLTDKKYLNRVVDRFRADTADAWYSLSPEELLGESVPCPKCGGTHWRKEMDILDVWFESGASHLAVLEPNGLPWPADMYLEGGDQYRGWFHSSLLVGMALRGAAPYREIVTNGWTLDGEGRAMSKSLGNTVEPEKVIKKYGADVLRLWVASVEYNDDVRMSDVILERMSEAYRKFRNTFRYILGALDGFDPAAAPPVAARPEIDQWILSRLDRLVADTRAHYDAYRFHMAYRGLYGFCVDELSATYFDIVKDRLYTGLAAERACAQATLQEIGHALFRLSAPILTFTAEEAWSFLRRPDDPESIHLTEFPTPSGRRFERAGEWDRLLELRGRVSKALEIAREEKRIGGNLEAFLHLKGSEEIHQLLSQYESDLPSFFLVSGVRIENHGGAELAIEVERAGGQKCERCWKYKFDIGSDPQLPTVCLSCARAVAEMMG